MENNKIINYYNLPHPINKINMVIVSEKTHKWEIDYNGDFHHSDSCWCQYKDNEKLIAPKDNDGRSVCFWCGRNTVCKSLFISQYDFCELCNK